MKSKPDGKPVQMLLKWGDVGERELEASQQRFVQIGGTLYKF